MKKFISMLLSLTLMLGCFGICATATTADPAIPTADYTLPENNGLPLIVVSGMDFTGLYFDADNPETKAPAIKSVSFSGIVKTLGRAISAAIKGFSLTPAVEVIADYVADILGGIACDKSGNSKYNVSVKTFPEAASSYPVFSEFGGSCEMGIVRDASRRFGGENVYYFFYDWRIDPYINSDALYTMIQKAKTEHNCDKVNIICISMGGIVTINYLDKYGHDDIANIVFNSSTVYGTYVATDLYNGRVKFDPVALYNFLSYTTKDNKLLSTTIKLANKTGLIGKLTNIANKFSDKYKDIIYGKVLTETMGTIPGYWATMTPEDYDSAIEFMFGENREEYAEIIAITDRLHDVAVRRDEIINAAKNDGVNISFIACYNIPLAPVYEHAATQGDGTLETTLMSCGATVADIGSVLSEEYLAQADLAFVSQDKLIDASTCTYRDMTWFVKDCKHVGGRDCSDFNDLLFTLAYAENQVTVDSYELFPRFLVADAYQNFIY